MRSLRVRLPPSQPKLFLLVAQLVERLFEAQKVTGSIPVWEADGESPNGMASLFDSETMQVRVLLLQPMLL